MAETKKTTTAKTTAAKSKAAETRAKNAAEKEKAKAKQLEMQEKLHKKKRLHDEIIAIIQLVIAALILVSLFVEDSGALGGFASKVLFGLFGRVAYFLPIYLILYAILIFANKASYLTIRSSVCSVVLFFLVCAMNASFFSLPEAFGLDSFKNWFGLGIESGGIFGMFLGVILKKLLGITGLYIVCVAGIIITLLFIIDTPISVFFDNMKIKRAAGKKVREEQLIINKELIEREQAERARKLAEEEDRQRKAMAQKAQIAKSVQNIAGENKKSKPEATEAPAAETESADGETAQEELPVFNPNFTPETIGLTTAPSHDPEQKKKNIMELMQDDNLFGQPVKKSEGFGLNGDMPKTEGYGLDGNASPFIPEESYSAPTEVLEGQSNQGYSYAGSSSKPAASGSDTDYESDDTDYFEADNNSSDANIPQEDNYFESELKPVRKVKTAPSAESMAKIGEEIEQKAENIVPEYKFPPLSLLKKTSITSQISSKAGLAEQAKVLEETLHSFNVSAKVVDMVKGPTVTRFEVQPAVGVKVSSITRLQDDLALNLRARSLRIEAPIPGKAAVGIEVSNEKTNMVLLSEILDSKEFKEHKSKIAVGLGQGIAGDPVVCNLKEMPHMLIAGTTGSGKSVCVNSIILSLLYKAKPDEVKLMLIDPKVVELSNYNGIPHLLIPVVTDPAKASAALGWAVSEMDERYHKFAEEGVRDLKSYNEVVVANGENDKLIPQIVIIIDELADLIMAAQNSVEDSICRLAQKARAAGMHLIVATQRPSVDVITGVIKANIPSRIAFAVSSLTDSRTILDMGGAEKLLGKGDMLYSPQSMSKPIRVQGCFVSDEEVNAVIEFLKAQNGENAVAYNNDVINAISKTGAQAAASNESEEDELLKDAIECVVRAEQASVSMLQRRFRIGYNRAARLIDLMEERGIVGPQDGARPRKVLMSVAQFVELESEAMETEGVEEEIF